MVSQDPYFFNQSIAENLRYGKPGASESELLEACRQAGILDLVEGCTLGLDTVIGERGHTLSGGERQRLAIARIFLKGPRILMLDEATSSLDHDSELKVREATERLMEGRTTLVVAHRFSTVERAARIFILEAGKISHVGTKAELLRQSKFYRLFTGN
jgi:ABC-type multidrug transport system fused ATPase/permease subunit